MNERGLAPKVRFLNFDKDWEKRKLKEVSKYSNGGSFENSVKAEGKYELITLKSVDMAGNLVSSGRFIDDDIPSLKRGTLVMILSEQSPGLLGMTAQIPKDNTYILNQRVAEILPNDSVNSYFLSLAINRNQQYFSKHGAGTKVQNISKPNVENYEFLCPDIIEQNKISNFFENLVNNINLQQQLLNDHKQLKKAMLQKMFPQKGESVPELRFDGFKENWKKINLGTLVEISSGVNGNVTLNNGKYKLTRIETISNGKVNFNKVGFTNELPEKKYLLNKGDILYSNINSLAHIGKIAKFNLDYELYHGINLLRLSPKRILNSDFLYQYLSTVTAKQWAVAHANQAVNQASINQTELSKQLVHIPEYEEQAQIGNFFKQLDETIEIHEKKLETYQELKKAMLQKMFV